MSDDWTELRVEILGAAVVLFGYLTTDRCCSIGGIF